MNIADKKELKLKIQQMILDAEKSIIDMEGMTAPVSPENSIGRVSRMDAINNKSVMEAALRNKRAKLGKLRTALLNIENDDFGICSNCRKAIQTKRLIFMPESTKCIRCADR